MTSSSMPISIFLMVTFRALLSQSGFGDNLMYTLTGSSGPYDHRGNDMPRVTRWSETRSADSGRLYMPNVERVSYRAIGTGKANVLRSVPPYPTVTTIS